MQPSQCVATATAVRVSQVYDSLSTLQKSNAEMAEKWMSKIFAAGLRKKSTMKA